MVNIIHKPLDVTVLNEMNKTKIRNTYGTTFLSFRAKTIPLELSEHICLNYERQVSAVSEFICPLMIKICQNKFVFQRLFASITSCDKRLFQTIFILSPAFWCVLKIC